MLRARWLPVLLLAGCISAPVETVPGAEPTVVRNPAEGGVLAVGDDPTSTVTAVPAAFDATWNALFRAYEQIGIEVLYFDRVRGLLGNRDFTVRRRIGDSRVSRYFDCGSTTFGQTIADTYPVTAAVLTEVVSIAPDSTRIITSVRAAARDPATSSDPVRCGTRGVLEDRILYLTRLQVGG